MVGRFKPQYCGKGSSLERTLLETVLYKDERCKMQKKSGNVARCAAQIITFLTSDHVSFTKTTTKISSYYNLQLSFFKCSLDVAPKAYSQRSMPYKK